MNTPAETSTPPGHWPDIARNWRLVGTPLRPIDQDLTLFMNAIGRWFDDNRRPPRALILGVTPELFQLSWPSGTGILAADHTQAMIDGVWPGPKSAAVCCEWTQLPCATASRDIALCDGGVHLLTYPQDHLKWVAGLHRVIAPDGFIALRLFVPPSERERADSVIDELLAGNISSLNVLKLRLGMAMQSTPDEGVQLARVWEKIHLAAPDFPQLAAKIGWPLDHLLAINTYRDCEKRYHFLTTLQVQRLFCEEPGGFVLERIDTPTYELGEGVSHSCLSPELESRQAGDAFSVACSTLA